MGVYQIVNGLNLYADDFGVTSIAPWFWLYVGLFAFFLIALKVWIMAARRTQGTASDHDAAL